MKYIATQPTTQIAAYTPKVHDGASRSIIGRKASPTTKLQPQLVSVEMDDPRDRTLKGNNSDCCPIQHEISYLPCFCKTTELTWYRSHSGCVRRNIKNQRDEDSDSGQAGLSREIIIMHGI